VTEILFWLAAATLLVWVVSVLEAWWGTSQLTQLVGLAPLTAEECPAVTVVVAACNEERDIEGALQSLLAQDYPALEIVAVNDRSTDGTGAILERLAGQHDALRIVHVAKLPAGWLGKCHAQHVGASAARGEWLLFTDADVVFSPRALRRAMRYATEHELDHLAVMPDMDMPGPLLGTFAGTFAVAFGAFARPWRARDPKSRCHIGIGAFNLVRTAVYRARGGHTSIANRPDDDLRLGRLIKSGGGRQDCLFGKGAVVVPWYRSLGEILRGMEKNAYAAVNYHLALVVLATAMELLLCVAPFAALFVTDGWTLALNAVTCALILGMFASTGRGITVRRRYAVLFPFGVLFLVYAQWRSVLLTLVRGGIMWRGTFYALRELRAPSTVVGADDSAAP
jgi:glycosyltransferase involved in cell wall biosynthesis